MAKSASDLAEGLSGLGEQIRTAAVSETRKYLSQAIKDQLTAKDAVIVAVMDEDMPMVVQMRRARFEAEGVSEDFLAGAAFAAALVADERFEY